MDRTTAVPLNVVRFLPELTDEGKTWQRVPGTANQVTRLGHPAGATSGSPRASATARDGNAVEQTRDPHLHTPVADLVAEA